MMNHHHRYNRRRVSHRYYNCYRVKMMSHCCNCCCEMTSRLGCNCCCVMMMSHCCNCCRVKMNCSTTETSLRKSYRDMMYHAKSYPSPSMKSLSPSARYLWGVLP